MSITFFTTHLRSLYQHRVPSNLSIGQKIFQASFCAPSLAFPPVSLAQKVQAEKSALVQFTIEAAITANAPAFAASQGGELTSSHESTDDAVAIEEPAETTVDSEDEIPVSVELEIQFLRGEAKALRADLEALRTETKLQLEAQDSTRQAESRLRWTSRSEKDISLTDGDNDEDTVHVLGTDEALVTPKAGIPTPDLICDFGASSAHDLINGPLADRTCAQEDGPYRGVQGEFYDVFGPVLTVDEFDHRSTVEEEEEDELDSMPTPPPKYIEFVTPSSSSSSITDLYELYAQGPSVTPSSSVLSVMELYSLYGQSDSANPSSSCASLAIQPDLSYSALERRLAESEAELTHASLERDAAVRLLGEMQGHYVDLLISVNRLQADNAELNEDNVALRRESTQRGAENDEAEETFDEPEEDWRLGPSMSFRILQMQEAAIANREARAAALESPSLATTVSRATCFEVLQASTIYRTLPLRIVKKVAPAPAVEAEAPTPASASTELSSNELPSERSIETDIDDVRLGPSLPCMILEVEAVIAGREADAAAAIEDVAHSPTSSISFITPPNTTKKVVSPSMAESTAPSPTMEQAPFTTPISPPRAAVTTYMESRGHSPRLSLTPRPPNRTLASPLINMRRTRSTSSLESTPRARRRDAENAPMSLTPRPQRSRSAGQPSVTPTKPTAGVTGGPGALARQMLREKMFEWRFPLVASVPDQPLEPASPSKDYSNAFVPTIPQSGSEGLIATLNCWAMISERSRC